MHEAKYRTDHDSYEGRENEQNEAKTWQSFKIPLQDDYPTLGSNASFNCCNQAITLKTPVPYVPSMITRV